MPTFRMKFSGLCGFVPVQKSAGQEPEMVVLLARSDSERAQALAASLGRKKKAHFPLLRYDWRNRPGNGTFAANNAGAFWELFEEDIEVRVSNPNNNGGAPSAPADPKVGILLGARPVGSSKPDPANPRPVEDQEKDFTWIPCMKDVLPDAAAINPNCLVPIPSSENDAVTARIYLRGGELRCNELGEYNEAYVVAQFVPSPPSGNPLKQAIAHEAAWELDLAEGDRIVLAGRRFGESQERLLELDPNETGEIEVHVTNLCFYYRDGQIQSEDPPAPDDDFVYFYSLSSREPEDLIKDHVALPVPVPIEFSLAPQLSPPKPDAGGADPIRCTMCCFETFVSEESMPVPEPVRLRDLAVVVAGPAPALLPSTLLPLSSMPQPPVHGRSHPGRQLKPPVENQENSNWCWAAVAAAVHEAYSGQKLRQCEVAATTLHRACCDGAPCNEPQSTGDALKALGHEVNQVGALSFEQVRGLIGVDGVVGKPVASALQGPQGVGHAVTVYGWDISNDVDRVYVTDPLGPTWRVFNHKRLTATGNRKTRWERTYLIVQ